MENTMVGRVYNRRHAPRTKVGLKSLENLEKWCLFLHSIFTIVFVCSMCVCFLVGISLELGWTRESGAWCVPRILKCLKHCVFQI